MSNLNVRALDPPNYSHQFTQTVGRFDMWVIPKTKTGLFFHVIKTFSCTGWSIQSLSRLHGHKHKCALCSMKHHWTWLLSDIVAWDSFWHGTHYFYLFSDKPTYRFCCDGHFPCFGRYIFPQLQTCSADCTERSFSSNNIPSNF